MHHYEDCANSLAPLDMWIAMSPSGNFTRDFLSGPEIRGGKACLFTDQKAVFLNAL